MYSHIINKIPPEAPLGLMLVPSPDKEGGLDMEFGGRIL